MALLAWAFADQTRRRTVLPAAGTERDNAADAGQPRWWRGEYPPTGRAPRQRPVDRTAALAGRPRCRAGCRSGQRHRVCRRPGHRSADGTDRGIRGQVRADAGDEHGAGGSFGWRFGRHRASRGMPAMDRAPAVVLRGTGGGRAHRVFRAAHHKRRQHRDQSRLGDQPRRRRDHRASTGTSPSKRNITARQIARQRAKWRSFIAELTRFVESGGDRKGGQAVFEHAVFHAGGVAAVGAREPWGVVGQQAVRASGVGDDRPRRRAAPRGSRDPAPVEILDAIEARFIRDLPEQPRPGA
jgi:hypothetical protein